MPEQIYLTQLLNVFYIHVAVSRALLSFNGHVFLSYGQVRLFSFAVPTTNQIQ